MDPKYLVTVGVANSPNPPGGFAPAGNRVSPPPSLAAGAFWIEFTIENRDSLGTLNSVSIFGSGATPGPLGSNVCQLAAPIPPLGTGRCVVGGATGFAVQPGPATTVITFNAAVGSGTRQGTPGKFFDPPLPGTVTYDGAPFQIDFVFDTPGGTRIRGKAFSETIPVDVADVTLSKNLRIDCTDQFPNGLSGTGGSPVAGEPKVVAYVIGTFSSSGAPLRPPCSDIPRETLTWTWTTTSDTQIRYVGP